MYKHSWWWSMQTAVWCSSVTAKVSQGGLLNAVCLYLWCGLKGYWVSCVVEAGSLGDYRWAGNCQRKEYTEACLCPWPHFDQRPGPSCICQAPRDQLTLRGELLYSPARARIRVNNIRAAETRTFWLFTFATALNYATK